ncbi:MAG: TonB-dependent receptor, partial [Bacteroidales bacterium]|nr:TonB-dependent receptor [Bacteroidales bacterium]
ISDYRIAPWSISNLSLTRSFELSTVGKRTQRPELTLTLSCNNIFDQPYQIVQGYPMPGRSLLAGIDYRF